MDNIQIEPVKKKYTNVLVVVIITVILLISGSIFLVIWGITSYKDGILLRKEKNVNEQSYGSNRQLVNIEENIPLEINITDLRLVHENEYSDSIEITLDITNKSKYTFVGVSLNKSSLENDNIYFYSWKSYYIELDSMETREVKYIIDRYFDDNNKEDNSIYLEAEISYYGYVDWEDDREHYINLTDGVIY